MELTSIGAEQLRKLRLLAVKLRRSQENLGIPIQHDPLKRAFDIVFSVLVMILLSPFFFALSILILSTSPGPIFYKSRRLGRGGKIIECLKFRTMYVDAEIRLQQLLQTNAAFQMEWNAFQKLKLDPRTTPLGNFLRKTSLDELPQFWNVLKGDLSVVGPRPPVFLGPPEQYLEELYKIFGKSTEKILSVRPGITGVWQISGRSLLSLDERRQLEEKYAETHTFVQDLLVIVKTIPAVLFSRGAF